MSQLEYTPVQLPDARLTAAAETHGDLALP